VLFSDPVQTLEIPLIPTIGPTHMNNPNCEVPTLPDNNTGFFEKQLSMAILNSRLTMTNLIEQQNKARWPDYELPKTQIVHMILELKG
jgi:hypothetical protein